MTLRTLSYVLTACVVVSSACFIVYHSLVVAAEDHVVVAHSQQQQQQIHQHPVPPCSDSRGPFKRVFTLFEAGDRIQERGQVVVLASILASTVMRRKVQIFSNSMRLASPSFVSPHIEIVRYKRSDLFNSSKPSRFSRFPVSHEKWCAKAKSEDFSSQFLRLRLMAITSFADMARLVLCDNDCFYFDADAMVIRPPHPGLSMFPLTSFVDSDEQRTRTEFTVLVAAPHMNNNYFSFQQSPFYASCMSHLIDAYTPRTWGSLGEHLFQRTWDKMNCRDDAFGHCPLVYGAPFTLFPGYVERHPPWHKYIVTTQSVVHHYSAEKGLAYFKEYLKVLLSPAVYANVTRLFEEERRNYTFTDSFNPINWSCDKNPVDWH